MRQVNRSLHAEAAATLRERIFSGELAPGCFLDEVSLCDSLQISRTPLREALKVLSAEGLVRHEQRLGCFVNQVSEQDLDDIFPVIALLEGRCAYEAAARATDSDLAALQDLHEELAAHAQAGRTNAYYETNYAIHEAIIRLANNRWLAQTISDLRKILKLARLQSLQLEGRLAHSLQEHLAVFDALRRRDCAAADQAMRTHLLRQRQALRDLAQQRKSDSVALRAASRSVNMP